MRTVEEIKADIDGVNVAERPFACSPTSHKTWQGWKLTQLKAELLAALTASITLDRLSEICSAERDGRVAVLPCKVGDTVYEALLEWDCTECLKTSFKPKVRERKVTHFMFGKSGDIIVGVSGDGADYLIYGKTVFLTRAEAEKALEKEAQHD